MGVNSPALFYFYNTTRRLKVTTQVFPYDAETLKSIRILAPISRKQETYLNDDYNDVIFWGGSAACGKSYISLLDVGIAAVDDPHFRAGIVRRTKEQLKGAGSLYDEASGMYSVMDAKPKAQAMEFEFPKGGYVKMSHSDRPADKYNFQGWQVTRFLVDEASQLREGNITYLLSRLRSKSHQPHQLKMAANPDYDSFLRGWLEKGGYLDEDGLCKPEMDGVTTYMLELGSETIFTATREEMIERLGEELAQDALKFVYYAANVNDNPYIAKYQPSYLRKLKNLPHVERMRLYEGSWTAREEAAGLFKREWVNVCDLADVPMTTRRIRAWDKAATIPSSKYPDPDWTVGVKGTLDSDGNLYIIDIERFRDRPAGVQSRMEQVGHKDGKNTLIGIPVDVGAAGLEAAMYSEKMLRKEGFTVIRNKANKSKELRFQPFAILAQNRNVFVVKGDWNEVFFKELEAFGSGVGHDDICDSVSDLYKMLTNRAINLPSISINNTKDVSGNSLLI